MFNVVLLTGYVSCKNATIPSGTGIQVAPLAGSGSCNGSSLCLLYQVPGRTPHGVRELK